MTLINKLQQDQLTARKAKDKFTTTVLSTLYSECNRVGFDDGKRETTDGEVLKVIQKFVKNVDETMSLVEGTDKHTELSKEKDIYVQYLPSQLSTHELNKVVEHIVYVGGFSSPRDMGSVMKLLKESHDGTYDGKLAASVVKAHLG
jgi:uncharacterized protein YqeY